jgi:hypothetical protein
MSKPGVEITRQEFYELLWAEPLKALVERFGSDYNDLVALAEKHRVPRPAKGYWTKRAAGAPAPPPPLPENSSPAANSVFIPCRRAERDKRSAEQAKYNDLVGVINLPKDLSGAHSLTSRWIAERQRHSRAINSTCRISDHYYTYCKTDTRRHYILEALIRFIEKLGGKIKGEHDEKWILICIDDANIKLQVREVLKEAWVPLSEREKMLSQHRGKSHHSLLNGSGVIRLHIIGGFAYGEKTWSDAPGIPIEKHLKQIAAALLIARDKIIQYKQEQEAQWQYVAERKAIKRAEMERRQREDNRWACLVDLSKRADEVESIRRFLERLERCGLSEDHQAGDRTIAEWIAWAREQIRERDPLAGGGATVFDRLSLVT